MKVTIKGLTNSTIAFNKLNIVVSGNSRYPDLYKESIARHIDVVTEDQLNEINCLIKSNLISVEIEEESQILQNNINSSRLISNLDSYSDLKSLDKDKNIKEQDNNKKKRGRPKGSFKKSIPFVEKKDEGSFSSVSDGKKYRPAETIKPLHSPETPSFIEDRMEESLRAMEKINIEDEQAENVFFIDEQKVSQADKMGSDATIYNGKDFSKIKFENSILPEAKQIVLEKDIEDDFLTI